MPAFRGGRHAAAVLGYVCVAVLFAWPLPLQFTTALPGPPSGDTGVYVWNLWQFRHNLEQGQFPFYTRDILALTPPAPLTLHNYTPVANLVAAPILRLFGPVATFNLLVIASPVVAAFAMYVFLRSRLPHDDVAAWVGGLAFGFSPFMMARAMEHFSLLQAAPIPTFAWLAVRFRDRPSRRVAAGLGLTVAWAFLSDPYYAVYCVMLAAFMVLYGATVRRPAAIGARPMPLRAVLNLAILCVAGLVVGMAISGGWEVQIGGLRLSLTTLYTPVLVLTLLVATRAWLELRLVLSWARFPTFPSAGTAAAGLLACAALLAPVLYALAAAPAEAPWRGPGTPWRSSAPGVDVLAFLVPNPLHPWLGAFAGRWIGGQPGGFVENVAALPWVVLITVAAAVGWRRLTLPPGSVAFTIFFGLLALGPFVRVAGLETYVPTPWAILRYLPFVGAARMPTRFAVLVAFAMAAIFALAVAHLRGRSRQPSMVAAALVAVLLFELLPAPRTLHSAVVPTIYQIVAQDPRPVQVLNLPFGLRDGLGSEGDFSAVAQFYQTFHGKPLVGGYLSRLPRGDVDRYRRISTMRVLLDLSAGRQVDPDHLETAVNRARVERWRLKIGYVAVDTARTPPAALAFAKEAFGLRLVAADHGYELYAVENADETGTLIFLCPGGQKDECPRFAG